MVHPARSAATLLVRASVTPFLILLTPFAVFVHHHHYGFTRPEIVIGLLVCATIALPLAAAARQSRRLEVVTIAALLTWFADIQLQDPGMKQLVLLFTALCLVLWPLREHAPRIVSLMMATILGTSLLPLSRVSASHSPQRDREASDARTAVPSALPLIVHLVLDEHIGVEGLPDALTTPALKEEIRSFFVERGFRLFGGAYSEHPATLHSLSHLLNLVQGRYVSGLTAGTPVPNRYRLTRNAYFERLERAGYAIRVHRIDYLDVCAGRVTPWACRSYEEASLAVLHDLPASASAKFSVVASVFLARSHAVMRLKNVYSRGRRLLKSSVDLPAWNWDRNLVSPIATMAALDAIAADLARVQRGELFFAHLLLPHHPYVYDPECRPRSPAEWRLPRDRDDVDPESGDNNTAPGRALRYSLYAEQIRCTGRTIARLISAIPPPLRRDAVVIIHGDHGSRIGMVEPNSGRESSFGRTDYADFFSTLFAVRSTGVEAGYDRDPTPITCLLRTLVESNFTSLATLHACSSPDVVFLHDHTPRALPDFTAPAAGR